MKIRVHLLHPASETALDELRTALRCDVVLTMGPELPEPAHYQILVAGRPRREHITASPNLEALIIPWSGLPDPTRWLMREFPWITVHNLHHNAVPVAEMALSLLLAAAKAVVPFDRALRAHDWTPRSQLSTALLLRGRTALVLGYGAIGREVARLCQGLGLTVMATRRRAEEPSVDAAVELHAGARATLHRLLPRADILIVCLPHTPETDGLLGAPELALLPKQAILINVGRGPIVDEEALYRALCDGTLHAAGLDVWYQYPADDCARVRTAPSRFPFHELDNVVMSPHRGGLVSETDTLRMAALAELLNAAAKGEPIPNRVNLQAGY
jgi:phosphoglycerate dehydrogenase-like enzyme